MSILLGIIVVLHLLCWAIALGLWVAAAGTREPNKGIAHASAGALVLGLIAMIVSLVAGEAGGHLFFTLKLVFALVATVCAFIAISRRRETPAIAWYAIPAAIAINVVIGVFGIGA